MPANTNRNAILIVGALAMLLTAAPAVRAQDDPAVLPVEHPECVFFGPKHDELVKSSPGMSQTDSQALSELTDRVTQLMTSSDDSGGGMRNIVPGDSRTNTSQ